jgi:eukaryotic-like serine/threonine-protein kinase
MPNPSNTTRSLIVAGCVAGSACASGPQYREPPKPEACPPEAVEMQEQLGIHGGSNPIQIHPFHTLHAPAEIVLSEGPVTAEILGPWGSLPDKTPLYGELFFGEGRVYGRFNRLSLPDGALVPVCLSLTEIGDPDQLGVKMRPGSTSEKARVNNAPWVMALSSFVNRFE